MKKKKFKPAPDDTVYLTPSGDRVRVARGKQFPSRPDDPYYMKEITARANEAEEVVRISDGHALWGYTRADLTPEKP